MNQTDIEKRLDDAESLLASATDLLNTWAREYGVVEARNEREIKFVISRLWDQVAWRLYRETYDHAKLVT